MMKKSLLAYPIAYILGLGTYHFFTEYHINSTFDKTVDYNDDGYPNEMYERKDPYTSLLKVDRNSDGKPDQITTFINSGEIMGSRSDDDFNGVFESETFYASGLPTVTKVDSNGDGEVDLIWFYENGVLRRSLIYDNKSNKRVVTYYSFGKSIRSEIYDNGSNEDLLLCFFNYFEDRACEPQTGN